MSTEPVKKCQGCPKQIPEKLQANFCLSCQGRLNKNGLCAQCGENSRKPARGKAKQSKYCEPCQKSFRAFEARPEHQGSYRSAEMRENTRETKQGPRD